MPTITPVTGRQLDRCQVCGDAKHRSELVRTPMDFLQGEAQNRLEQSDYDGTFWTSTY